MKKRNFLAALAALTVMTSMFSVSAGAVGTKYTPGLTAAKKDDTTPVSINNTSFDKYLVMDINANVPNATFNFAISKYSDEAEKKVIVAAAGDDLAVINGVEGAKFTVSKDSNEDVVFTSDDTATTEETAKAEETKNEAVVFGTPDDKDEKFAAKKLTLDFSEVQFDEPGVYRYLITETGTNQAIANDTGVTGDSNTYRTLDVYVEDYDAYYNALNEEDRANYTAPTGKELFITGYVLYNGKNDKAPSKNGGDVTKSSSYTNTYTTHDLTFSKTVAGNQGSKDKYFKFDVTISGAVAGTVYTVDLSNADASINANPNSATTVITEDIATEGVVTQPAAITVGADGTVTQTFYLQHGQSIIIRGLADGTSYEVKEAPEDYVASAEVTGDNKKADNTDITLENNTVSDDSIEDDTTAAFTNTRQGTIPTGVILSVAAPVAIGVVVLGGIVFLVIRNKKRESEDEE